MRILYFFSLLLLLTSCSSSRKTQQAPVVISDTSASEIINGMADAAATFENIFNRHIEFDNFSARVNVDYSDDKGQQQNFNAYLRMKQDSVIWMSINAIFGIEVFRVMITSREVHLLDKTNKIYLQRPIDYLYEVTGLPLNYYTLQDLLIGNPVFFDSSSISLNSKTGNLISITSTGKFFKNLSLFDDNRFTIISSRLDDYQYTDRYAILEYFDYEPMDFLFSTKRKILVNDEKKMQVGLEFKQVDFKEQLTFPFSIPKNYTAN